MTKNKTEIPISKDCLTCGAENPFGAQIEWKAKDGKVVGLFKPNQYHSGFSGIVHGGMLSALLDEAAGWAVAMFHKEICFTANLNVDFVRPLSVHDVAIVVGRPIECISSSSKSLKGSAEIVNDYGTVFAKCEAVFVPLPKDKADKYLDTLQYRSNKARRVTRSNLFT